eukprot:15158957-Alexandrium_andersonii.AAC.1
MYHSGASSTDLFEAASGTAHFKPRTLEAMMRYRQVDRVDCGQKGSAALTVLSGLRITPPAP